MKSQTDKLIEEYFENVLIHISPFATKKEEIKGLMGIAGKKLGINLSSKSIISLLPELQPKKSTFLHFTSLRALQSILNEKCIRMYNLNNMNDPNEVSFSLSNTGLSDTEIYRIKEKKYCLSLCDFTILESENILNLWRFYGYKGWGVAIELDIEIKYSDFLLAKIIYSEFDLKNFISANSDFEKKYNINVNLKELLGMPFSFYKNPFYNSEKEVRLLFDGRECQLPHKAIEDLGYKFDFNKRNEKVSYYNLKLYNDNNDFNIPNITIKNIHLGFQYSKEQFKEIKKQLLNMQTVLTETRKKTVQFDVYPSKLKNVFR